MAHDFTKLVASGRAKAPGQLWSAEEWEAVIKLEKEFKLQRTVAADFVRNGIMTAEDYKKATKKKFVPQTIEEATEEVAKKMKENGEKVVKKPKSKKKKTK